MILSAVTMIALSSSLRDGRPSQGGRDGQRGQRHQEGAGTRAGVCDLPDEGDAGAGGRPLGADTTPTPGAVGGSPRRVSSCTVPGSRTERGIRACAARPHGACAVTVTHHGPRSPVRPTVRATHVRVEARVDGTMRSTHHGRPRDDHAIPARPESVAEPPNDHVPRRPVTPRPDHP